MPDSSASASTAPLAGASVPLGPPEIGRFDRRYANRAMLLLGGLIVVVLYIEAMLTPSLPSIAAQFNVSEAQVSLVLAVYLVSGCALAPIIGKLGDIYGKKRVLIYVLVIYTVSVSVTGFSPNFAFLIAARTVQGIGLGIFPLAMTLVREEFPRELVPRSQGILSGMFGVGLAISLPLGAFISNGYGWQVTYHTAIPFVVLLTVLSAVVLRESRYRRPQAKVDYIGATGLGSSLALIVLGLSLGPSWGWSSAGTWTLMGLGLAILVPVALYERWASEPILNYRMLKERNLMVTNLVVTLTGLGYFLALQAMTFRFQSPPGSGFSYTIFGTGVALVPFAIAQLIFAPLAGHFVSRTGVRPMVYLGSVVGCIGFGLAAFANDPVGLMTSEFVASAGLAIVIASIINLMVLTVEPKDLSLATALNTVFRLIGSSVGAPIAGTIMTTFAITVSAPSGALSAPSPLAYEIIFSIAAASFVVIAFVTFFSREMLGRRPHVSHILTTDSGSSAAVPPSPPISTEA
ncbi:MAG: MFS transporter [Thermoplasmata archaeon]